MCVLASLVVVVAVTAALSPSSLPPTPVRTPEKYSTLAVVDAVVVGGNSGAYDKPMREYVALTLQPLFLVTHRGWQKSSLKMRLSSYAPPFESGRASTTHRTQTSANLWLINWFGMRLAPCSSTNNSAVRKFHKHSILPIIQRGHCLLFWCVKVATAMPILADDVKLKWKNLRDTMALLLRKSNRDPNTWRFYEYCSFLNNYERPPRKYVSTHVLLDPSC